MYSLYRKSDIVPILDLIQLVKIIIEEAHLQIREVLIDYKVKPLTNVLWRITQGLFEEG